jgi:hypothetical protein
MTAKLVSGVPLARRWVTSAPGVRFMGETPMPHSRAIASVEMLPPPPFGRISKSCRIIIAIPLLEILCR